tara:strand:+ start:1645 stop:1872 length:228 start_codon:yes stop_codon:yes gene_type:complete
MSTKDKDKKRKERAANNIADAYKNPKYKRKEPLPPSLSTKPNSSPTPYEQLGPDEKRSRDNLNKKRKKEGKKPLK